MKLLFCTQIHLTYDVSILYFQKWAIDQELAACESLKLNHPHTQVRILLVPSQLLDHCKENDAKSNVAVFVYRLGMILLEISSYF